MHPISRFRWLFCALSLLFAGESWAQQVDAGAQIGTQQDVVRRGEEGIMEQRLQLRLSDPELGEIDLVSRAPKPKMFTFSTDQNFLYTSNAFLAEDNEDDTVFWNGRFNASFVPYATVNFTPRITFEQNFFRYDEFSELDFDSSSLTFDMKYDFTRDDTFFANLSFTGATLYSPHHDLGEFYTYGLFNASVTCIRPLLNTPVQWLSSAGVAVRDGDPSDFDRAVGYVNLVLFYSPTDTVQLSAYARPEMHFYLRDPAPSSRRDFNFSAGASATWAPIQYFSVSASASFTGNNSTVHQEDYSVFLPSVVLSGRISF